MYVFCFLDSQQFHSPNKDAKGTWYGGITLGSRFASNSLMRPSSIPPADLFQALQEMARNPLRTIVPPWSWKAAACTAAVRATAFFVSNLKSGDKQAAKALLVEAAFAIFAGGLIGAISQHLRRAKPVWATALLLCIVLPGVMTLAQAGVHHIAKTQHQSAGLTASFCLASVAAAYTWYAMRQGALLGGVAQTSVSHDLRALPRVTLDFLLVIPRLVVAKVR